MVSFANSNTPEIKEADVQRSEGDLGLIFPLDYRRFLLNFNGGNPVPNYLLIPDLNEKVVVECFLGIGRPHFDLIKWTAEVRHSLDLPDEFIPIAFDPGGNNLIMKSADYGSPEIYYWDSGRHFNLSTDDENAFFVADSFTELLTKFDATP